MTQKLADDATGYADNGKRDGEATRRRRPIVLRNTVRGVLGLVFVAAATWLADYVTERIFGPENAAGDA